jgi:hypothetical protein
MEQGILGQMNVRLPCALEEEIRADAASNFGKNASEALRFYARLGLAVRKKYGPNFEVVVGGLVGQDDLARIKAAP